MEELKKCPFCGDEATFSNAMDNLAARIRCTKCHCKVEVLGDQSFERARNEWNTRKPMERIVERLEKLKEIAWYEECEKYEAMCDALEIVKEEM